MKIKELRDKSNDELVTLEDDLRKQLFRLRLSHFAGEGQYGRVHEFKTLRRDIARIKTILTERLKSA